MAMPIGDSNDLNTILLWAMGKPDPYGGGFIRDQDATDAARRLAVKAHKALSAGLLPGNVTLDRQAAIRGHQRAMTDIRISEASQ